MSIEQPPAANEKLPFDEKVRAIQACLLAALRLDRTLQDKDLVDLFEDFSDLSNADLLAKAHEAQTVIAAMQDFERIALTMRIGGILSKNPFTTDFS